MSIWIGMECQNKLASYQSEENDRLHLTLAFLEITEFIPGDRSALTRVLEGVALASSGGWLTERIGSLELWHDKFVVLPIYPPHHIVAFQHRLFDWLKDHMYRPSSMYRWRPHMTIRLDGNLMAVQADLDARNGYTPYFEGISLIVDGEWTTFPFG